MINNGIRTVPAVIKAHLAKATSPLPDQTPAIECGITLVGGTLSFMGALSETPEGGLRLLAPAPGVRPGTLMMEHFFDYCDVAVFTLLRPMTVETPRIVTA